eukprot:m.40201 g.40201  ORF g.40201 m.40201 type:complete len:411 (+) comp12732_c0_seq1:36-1268(+)
MPKSGHHYCTEVMFSQLLLAATALALTSATCDVTDYGAVGDGVSNDTLAILNAVTACSQFKPNSNRTVVFPPGHNFATWPLYLSGKQWSNMTYRINGNITNMATPPTWPGSTKPAILAFKDVSNVVMTGSGWIDGRGKPWWSIRKLKPESFAPHLMGFEGAVNVTVEGIHLLNSPIWTLKFDGCHGVTVTKLTILAPQTSPNTDGIDLDSCANAIVDDVYISNGDDEVAIGGDSSNILVQNSYFENGHGASIGSIGENGGTGVVTDVTFRNLTFVNTQNVARIKTWQGGHGHVSNITYDTLRTDKTRNTIFVTQYYCPHSQHSAPCKNATAAVNITKLTFRNIQGTYVDTYAGQLLCSDSIPCQGIVLDDIQLTQTRLSHVDEVTQGSGWACWKVHGSSSNVTPSFDCFD